MAATYPGLMVDWSLRHPQSPQSQQEILANGSMRELRSDAPQVFRLTSAQTGHLRPLEMGFRVVSDVNNVLSTVKAVMVTFRMKRRKQ
jgi:hypothetical protein